MGGASVFIDSNTFLYAHDRYDGGKREQARLWLVHLTETDTGVTNLQVLNEVTTVLLRKASRFAGGDPFAKVDVFADFGSSPLSNEGTILARWIHGTTHCSWWDCLLLASALELGCSHFLSEDLQDGQRVEADGRALTIVDPFAHSPGQILPSR